MYQDIAVAKGSTYDTLNKRMDRCQENIETVSDDIQRLQGMSFPFSSLKTFENEGYLISNAFTLMYSASSNIYSRMMY